jgi:hypothetical protein
LRALLKLLGISALALGLALVLAELSARAIHESVDLDAHTRARPLTLAKAEGAVRVLFAGASVDRAEDFKIKLEKAAPELKWDVLGLQGAPAASALAVLASDRTGLGVDVLALDTASADLQWLMSADLAQPPKVVYVGDRLLPALERAGLDGALGFSQLYSALRLHLAGADALPPRTAVPDAASLQRLDDTLRAAVALGDAFELDVFAEVPPGEDQGPLGPVHETFAAIPRRAADDAALAGAIAARVQERLLYLPVDRAFQMLSADPELKGDERRTALYADAARQLGDWKLELAGFDVTGATFAEIVRKVREEEEPLLRALREGVRRPVHPDDLLYFLDDVLRAGRGVLAGRQVHLTAARLRNSGVTLHPAEVFKGKPHRDYPWKFPILPIDEPKPPEGLTPPKDGAVLGPDWAARYENPETEDGRLASLAKKNPRLHKKVKLLTDQLKKQGADVFVDSTVRAPERGYLMWGAFLLKSASSDKQLKERTALLNKLNKEWKRNVSIQWRHPDGFEATVAAATAMADTYGVVYATKGGAKKSSHYEGEAVDFTVVGLPRTVELVAPNKKKARFDLSAAGETRDLSLSPELIEWVEKNFRLRKLKSDYPHWNDRR